jgi:hypothetical protein
VRHGDEDWNVARSDEVRNEGCPEPKTTDSETSDGPFLSSLGRNELRPCGRLSVRRFHGGRFAGRIVPTWLCRRREADPLLRVLWCFTPEATGGRRRRGWTRGTIGTIDPTATETWH